MTEVEEYVKVLQEWKEQPGKTITGVLSRVEETKCFKGRELEEVLRGVTSFHREIAKADEALVDVKWYVLCINAKKRLKKMLEVEEKQRKMQPALDKRTSSLVSYPEELTAGRGLADERILKFLFKSFLAHYEEGAADPRTVPFVQAVLKELKYKFDGTLPAT